MVFFAVRYVLSDRLLEILSGGKRPKRPRVWRTYERDVYIWRRVKRDGSTYEAAFDEWLSAHPDDTVEITAVIKAVNRIKPFPADMEFNFRD